MIHVFARREQLRQAKLSPLECKYCGKTFKKTSLVGKHIGNSDTCSKKRLEDINGLNRLKMEHGVNVDGKTST